MRKKEIKPTKVTKDISRRDFLKGAGFVIGGAAAFGSAGILDACGSTTTVTDTSTSTAVSTATSTATTTATATVTSTPSVVPATWDYTADIVIVGASAMGLPAAIRARDQGASVIVVEANYDVGGHAILSGGNVPLGGGTPAQIAAGITDSPDLLYNDLTDWSVVEPNGMPDYRYNDKAIMRAFADNCVPTWNFLVANGVQFTGPDNSGANNTGNSAPRESHTGWSKGPGPEGINGANGAGLIRPTEVSARTKGVQFLLNYHMNTIVREVVFPSPSGKVIGVIAAYKPTILPGQTTPLQSFSSNGNISSTKATVNIKANKAVIIATGGSTGNVNFRRMFDPRLSEEYCGLAGMPYSDQDASGELASMAIGASLWGTFNQTGEFGSNITKAGSIGCKYGYTNLAWSPSNPIFPLCGASGIRVSDYQDLIMVNMVGSRFYDETKGQFTGNSNGTIKNYVQGSYLNTTKEVYNPSIFLDAALAGIKGSTAPGGGPIWAIFDADAATREKWTLTPPNVDIAGGFFFSGNSLTELAANIKNQFQTTPMSVAALQAVVDRYNSFVDSGTDSDFGKPAPKYKIQTPPFYAAWCTPVIHDTRTGLRINGNCQVIDFSGNVISGLYAGGECSGGFSQHGLARCTAQGYIAGTVAVA